MSRNDLVKKWSQYEDDVLTEKVKAGLTMAQIAAMLHRTRNSVIGRVDRLGLRTPPVHAKDATLTSVIESVPVFPKNDKCVFPIGDVGKEDFKFCGEPVRHGWPYCDKCCRIAYQNWSASDESPVV